MVASSGGTGLPSLLMLCALWSSLCILLSASFSVSCLPSVLFFWLSRPTCDALVQGGLVRLCHVELACAT